jgi:hypothetical protein
MYEVLCITDNCARPLTLFLVRGWLREFKSRVQLVRRLFNPSPAHCDSQDDYLRGECLIEEETHVKNSPSVYSQKERG